MEKYAVDLDKLLDDFEYNEEQAVRPSQYLRSDLPAKKYQRPPFQRINIEDADFSPSKQTSSPVIPYRPITPQVQQAFEIPVTTVVKPDAAPEADEKNLSLDIVPGSVDSEEALSVPDLLENEKSADDILVSLKLPDVTETLTAEGCTEDSDRWMCDLIDHNTQSNEYEELHSHGSMSEAEITNNNNSAKIGVELIEHPSQLNDVAEDLSVKMLENDLTNFVQTYKQGDASDISQIVSSSEAEISLSTGKDENGNEACVISEISKHPTSSSTDRTDSNTEGDCSSHRGFINEAFESVEKEVRKMSINEVVQEFESSNIMTGIATHNEMETSINEAVHEIEAVIAKKATVNDFKNELEKLSVNENVPNFENNVRADPSEVRQSLIDHIRDKKDVVLDSLETEPAVTGDNHKPVQYMAEADIPDEELEKFLEELEEEPEEEREVVEDSAVAVGEPDTPEERPQRPSFLNLSGNSDGTEVGAAGSTPGVKDVETEDRDNEINEKGEAAGEGAVASIKVEEAMSPTVDASPPSPPESPICPLTLEERRLGKVSPFWVPDSDALNCMNCGVKFTLMKRRHHCRGCGKVLCSKCCDMRASLEYLGNQQHRVCEYCFRTLTKVMLYEAESESETDVSPQRRPNPNNPMEYCSTVPPPLQASPSGSQPPPSVLVPVLKREGSSKNKEPHHKKVMFSDGIRPGGDLTALDEPPTPRCLKGPHSAKRIGTPPGSVVPSPIRMLPPVDPTTQSFIINNGMPPVCEVSKGRTTYHEPWPFDKLMPRLRDTDQAPLLFAINRHLFVSLQIVQLDCCMGKACWAFSTRGMCVVGQDEVMVLLQMSDEENEPIPVDIFLQLHCIYQAADKGDVIKELGYWSVKQSSFLDSRQHGGFLFVRPTFQCVQRVEKPPAPYLVAVLIHRLELPWARLFPLRLMLRLGAEFRYYPCSLVSVRRREPVYFEIGQTIINLLADFRNYSYTLPQVQGLRIHMEAQQTTVLLPKNRYDQVVTALNNSNDPVLPFAGTFSPDADSHLVCMQSKGDEVTYSTQAINIHDKPRKVTGTSFVVFNASLKSSSVGLQAKSHMVEDGVMVQISSDTMMELRNKLRAMEHWSVRCGPDNEEVIQVIWSGDDTDFNRGVRSVIDGMPMDGIPSIRVHNGTDYMCSSRFIRWTQVFIIKCEDGATSAKIGDPLELNRLAEAIARATSTALTKAKLLDHLAIEGITTLALRATVTQDQVCYDVGGNEQKLEASYMNHLDNELIPVLHKASAANSDSSAVLELVFHILDQ